MAKKLTLAEIAGMDKLNLTPEEAAGVLGWEGDVKGATA